jgi:hypothetical protein
MVQQLKEQGRTTEGAHELLKYCPRTEFRRIMKYLDGLGYHSTIDYTYIKQLLTLATKNYDIKIDQPYDWQIDESEMDNNPTPRGHSSNSSTEGRSADHSPNHKPTVIEKLDKMVQRINNGSLNINGPGSSGQMQNGR